jgi:uncharacterized caspase-like protein
MRRNIPYRLCIAFAALLAFSATAQAPGDVRIALVIGNSAYAGAAALVNPANDAAAMTGALKTLGFSVTELKDGSRSQMAEAITRVRDGLKGKQGIGTLYYAGHGLQVDFRNYMVPVDAKLDVAGSVAAQTLDIGQVIDAFKAAGNRMNILVLDACRDNPFAGQASGKGLAPLDAPSGTFLAYATAPGNVAEDGDAGAGNGLYTGYLVKELQKPAARIEDVFKRVRLQVRQKSQGRQIPWESTSLEEDFFFNDGVKHTFRPADLERIASAARLKEEQLRSSAEQAQERERQQANQALEKYKADEAQRQKELAVALAQSEQEARLKRLSGAQAREQAFATEKGEWDLIKDSRKPDDFYAFLQKYPSGFISEQAQSQLERLQQAQVQAQATQGAPVPLPAGARRYYEGDEFVFERIDGFTRATVRSVQRVLRATDELVEWDNGFLTDQNGSVKKNTFGVHEPGVLLSPADLTLNKQWKTAYQTTRPDGVKETSFWQFKVVALEDVAVPAGTIRAYRVEGTGEASFPRGFTVLTGTHWIDPTTMLVVRADRLFRSSGRITDHFSAVLVRKTLVPRPG